MGFWDNVNAELKKAVEEGWTVVKDSAKIGKHRYRMYTLHKRAEKLFAEIGGVVYDMAKPPYENPLSRPEVLKLIEEIKKVEEETASLEGEISRMRKKEREEGGGGPGEEGEGSSGETSEEEGAGKGGKD